MFIDALKRQNPALISAAIRGSGLHLCLFRWLSGSEPVDSGHPWRYRDFRGSAAAALNWQMAGALSVSA